MYGDRIFRAHINVAFVCTDGVSCDRHGFQHRVRVALQNGTAHERAGGALVGVADDVFLAGGLRFGKHPFSACREAGAAASAKSGVEHDLDDLRGRHGGEHLRQRLIAVDGYVFLDAFGIDDTAVAKGDALLLRIEGRLVKCENLVALDGFVIEQMAHGTSADQMLLYDFGNILGLYLAVEGALRIYDHDRSERAESEASGRDDLDLVRDPRRFELGKERVSDAHGARGGASRTAADEHVLADAVTGVDKMTVSVTHRHFRLVLFFDSVQLFYGNHCCVFLSYVLSDQRYFAMMPSTSAGVILP